MGNGCSSAKAGIVILIKLFLLKVFCCFFDFDYCVTNTNNKHLLRSHWLTKSYCFL